MSLVARLWRDWLRPHIRSLAVILVFVVLIALSNGLYPILIKAIFEAFSTRGMVGEPIKINLGFTRWYVERRDALLYGPAFVIAATAAKGFALYGLTGLTNRLTTRIEADMQSALYAHLIRADLAQIGQNNPAALTQRFTTDFGYIRDALTRLSTVLLREATTMLVLFVVMLLINPFLTLVSLVIGPILAQPITRVGAKLRRSSTSTQEQIGSMAGIISESLSGARVAKAFRLEGYLSDKARASFYEVRRLKVKGSNARARLDPMLEIGGGIAVALVLWLIGWRILEGRSTVGDFAGFMAALMMASQPLRALGNLNAMLQEAASALSRYFALLDRRPEIRDKPDAVPLAPGPGEIRYEGVRFGYGEATPALNGIDLVVPAGQTTAIVGRSGSGKSTLLSLLPRLFDPGDGRILIDGQDIRDVTLASLRDSIALVTQDVVLFDDTVAANIAFGRPGASREDVVRAAEAAAAHRFVEAMPQGYDTQVGYGGARLSGGERQRISLARAFLKDAPILLLDEATSALDAEAEVQIRQALRTLMRGRTTLVIAHRFSTVRDADVVVVMDGGRIVETGTHDALGRGGGIYARLQALQAVGELMPEPTAA